MAIGKITAEKEIKKFLEGSFKNGFVYEAPFYYKENEYVKCFLQIQASDIGRINVGNAQIKHYEVEQLVNPILKKYSINFTPWTSTIQETEEWENLGNLKADTEIELSDTLLKIKSYIEVKALPFWEKYKTIANTVTLIKNLNDLLPTFTGEVDFNVIAMLYLGNDALYNEKALEFLNNQKELAKYSSEYKNYPFAFQELLETLERITFNLDQ